MKSKRKLTVLSGAGMSAESGIKTFRGSDGLWENYSIDEVATPQGWQKNPALVLEFYNARRRNIADAVPNEGHRVLKKLEDLFEVQIVTQNIDDLHERAGSSSIMHLHGRITSAKCVVEGHHLEDIGYREMSIEEKCPQGHAMRPDIVWFEEAVPMLEEAIPLVMQCDILLIVGTSMQVYPAASLIHYANAQCEIIVVDPDTPEVLRRGRIRAIASGASAGLTQLWQEWSSL
ncbi:MAG: SIR2 family NAD-dependent protein deacylase [Flavobacteriales bacterium]